MLIKIKYLISRKLNFLWLTLVWWLLAGSALAQPFDKTPVDTIPYQDTYIVIFTDQSWQYLQDENFNGILNQRLHDHVTGDTSLRFKLFWNTEVPFTYDNDISRLKDTIWLCSVDTSHNRWCLPIDGVMVSSFKYRGARFHHGVDLDLDIGDPVKAAFDGVVRYAQYNRGGFGNCVIIRHYNGLETYYAHLSKINVRPYQRVSAGQIIGLGGNTGRSFGPHLHFEIRFYDNALDPTDIFDFEKKTLKDENLFICPSMFNYRAVSAKNKLLEQYRHDPNMQSKIEDDYEERLQNPDTHSTEESHRAVTERTPSNAKYYKVRSGDTLSGIARKHGTSIDRLCNLNGLRRTSVLQIGQKLRVR